MILGLQIAGFNMGSEIDTKNRPGLEFNRHITGYCIGTQPLSEVVLIRNGVVLHHFPITNEKCEFEYDDSESLSQVVLDPKNPERSPFAYYYLRAVQKDGHIAWSSPIWVDLTARSAPLINKKPKKKSEE